jgi:hypothetical protein
MLQEHTTIALQCIAQALAAQSAVVGHTEQDLIAQAQRIARALRAGYEAFMDQPSAESAPAADHERQ